MPGRLRDGRVSIASDEAPPDDGPPEGLQAGHLQLDVAVLDISNHFAAGALLASIAGAGALTALILQDVDARRALVIGLTALILGSVFTVAFTLLQFLPVSPSVLRLRASASVQAFRHPSGSYWRRHPRQNVRA